LNKIVEVSLVRKKLGDAFGLKLNGVRLWPLNFQDYSLSAFSLGIGQACLFVSLAGFLSGISNLQDCWCNELLFCCDISISELVFVRFIAVLPGRIGTAVGICLAAC
jgi:hypothetical protein